MICFFAANISYLFIFQIFEIFFLWRLTFFLAYSIHDFGVVTQEIKVNTLHEKFTTFKCTLRFGCIQSNNLATELFRSITLNSFHFRSLSVRLVIFIAASYCHILTYKCKCKQIPSQAITFYLSVCTLYVRVHCTTIAIAMQSNCVASFEICLIDNRLHFEIPFHSNYYHCVNAKAFATIPTCIHFYFTSQLAKKKPTSITKILEFFSLRRNHILQYSQFMS